MTPRPLTSAEFEDVAHFIRTAWPRSTTWRDPEPLYEHALGTEYGHLRQAAEEYFHAGKSAAPSISVLVKRALELADAADRRDPCGRLGHLLAIDQISDDYREGRCVRPGCGHVTTGTNAQVPTKGELEERRRARAKADEEARLFADEDTPDPPAHLPNPY